MFPILRASVIGLALFATSAASAASMSVTPTTVEVLAGGATSKLSVHNKGDEPLRVQMRIYRWSLENGEDKLVPATNVVVSPPIASIKPHQSYTVRIVRLSKTPPKVEESYRVFVDEIPDPSKRRAGAVMITARFSVPVFFGPRSLDRGAVVWSQKIKDGKLYVSATNTGGRRERVADLIASGRNGRKAMIAKGLAGYVLARSSKSWVVPAALQKQAQPLRISAVGSSGPINADAAPPR